MKITDILKAQDISEAIKTYDFFIKGNFTKEAAMKNAMVNFLTKIGYDPIDCYNLETGE